MKILRAERTAEGFATGEERVWRKEYKEIKAIPSTTREAPSKALLAFAELLGLGPGKRVLDAGCGNGRNAIYVSSKGCQVWGVDFCDVALREAKQRALREGVHERVQWLQSSFLSPLPFPDLYFDIVLDIYTSCHFLEDREFRAFWEEMYRVTKVGGQLLCVLFSPKDEYYRRLLSIDTQRVVVDPSNGIAKKLYTRGQLWKFFSEWAKPELLITLRFNDLVGDRMYRRDIHALAVAKP